MLPSFDIAHDRLPPLRLESRACRGLSFPFVLSMSKDSEGMFSGLSMR